MEANVPQHPPLEIVKQGRVWLVEAYQQGTREGDTFSTHDSQIDAVRAAKTRMEADRRPCTLRWDSPNSVGNLYWNPLFERIDVRFDELLDAWTVVPERGTCAMAVCESRQTACDAAKRIQRDYDFKHLRAYDAEASDFETRDHRFLRYDITSSGVRFDPANVEEAAEPVEDGTDATAKADAGEERAVGPMSPSQLGASIPDVTKVTFIDTNGVIHRYATPWGDGTDAEILAVSRKHVEDPNVREVFERWLSRWQEATDSPSVAHIHESGVDPGQWVAYAADGHTLASTGTDLPVETRLSVIEQVVDAVEAVEAVSSLPVCGVHPGNIHVQSSGTDWSVTVANWGLEWATRRAVGTHESTSFTAPEQVDGRLTSTTAVYQVGALAYWLLAESLPGAVSENKQGALGAGDVSPERPVTPLYRDASDVIERALSTDPDDRYRSVPAFRRALRGVV